MNPWNIAKLLVNNCDSAYEVDELIAALSNQNQLNTVLSLLSVFGTESEVLSLPPDDSQSSTSPRQESQKKGAFRVGRETKLASEPTPVDDETLHELEAVFRSEGFTNRQVEEWVKDTFGIRQPIGKGSLRKYLVRLASRDDAIPMKMLLSTARLKLTGDSSVGEDITFYWDQIGGRP